MNSFHVLGVRVDAVQIPAVVSIMEEWIRERRSARFIAVTGMHGVMESRRSPEFKRVLEDADIVVPDGMSLVWVGRRQGLRLDRRVYGPELMETFLRETGNRYTHFLYGGAPGVAESLARRLRESLNTQVAGVYCPPFRPLNDTEERALAAVVERLRPDVIWVGLSTPTQERWMHSHRQLPVPVMVGVGAAFDFLAGTVRQAPPWMRENGLEWFYRLVSEPRRLWYRYLVLGSKFAWNVSLQLLRLKQFN
jgi:N-acetylglucosaminyldiphosphoundecaprenol N-acetyl-beta-D-mannosaminyltransferase